MNKLPADTIGPVAKLGLSEKGPSLHGNLELSLEQLRRIDESIEGLSVYQRTAIRNTIQGILVWRAALEELRTGNTEEDAEARGTMRTAGPLKRTRPLRIHRDDRMCETSELERYARSERTSRQDQRDMGRYLDEIQLWRDNLRFRRLFRLRERQRDRQ